MSKNNNKDTEQCTLHSVIVRCCNCNNTEEKQIDTFEKIQFIEQDCCDKCNDDWEKLPNELWYDAEMNAL